MNYFRGYNNIFYGIVIKVCGLFVKHLFICLPGKNFSTFC